MRFLVSCFPLIVCISGQRFDTKEVREMADGFESYFDRGERYAVLFVPSLGSELPGPQERKLISAWADHPRTLELSRRFCVGTAVLVENVLVRAALAALMAFRGSASKVESVPTVDKGLEYCIRRIKDAGLQLNKPPDLVRFELRRLVDQAR